MEIGAELIAFGISSVFVSRSTLFNAPHFSENVSIDIMCFMVGDWDGFVMFQ
jgi:hypothetical protein